MFPNICFIMDLGFIFQPMKFQLLFISRFDFAVCQTVHLGTKTNAFRAIFGYGEFLSQRAFKNQLPDI